MPCNNHLKDCHSVYFKGINDKESSFVLNTDAINVGLTTS